LDTPVAGFFRGRRCMVTGGLGFIGSNLALTLAAAGADVVVVDALIPTHGGAWHNIEGMGGIDVIVADLADAAAVREKAADAEYIFNLAGQVSHVDSMADPLFDLDVNTRSQLAFLEILRRRRSEAMVVYTSTRQIFGKPRYLPVDEEHPDAPVDINGVTQLAAEQFHLLYGELSAMKACLLRLSNVFGPRQRLLGDRQGFLPIFVRRALENEALTVFGDGSQQRDCLYVDDVVECMLLAAASPAAPGQLFNVGNHDVLSLREIAEAIVTAAGSGRVEFAPWPPDRDAIDIGSYHTDFSKAKRVLEWSPKVSFADGMKRTMDFYRAHRSRYL
jgi:UDP-glucose 4-epimerase